MSKIYKAFLFAFLISGCASGPESEDPMVLPEDESALIDEEGFAKPSSKLSVAGEKQKSSQTLSPGLITPDLFPIVVRVSKTTPVFSKPSARSRIVADVTRGTTLIARRQSPKGHWVFVEDEDGNQGWIPEQRTNRKNIVDKVASKPAEGNGNLSSSNVVSIDDIPPESETRFKDSEIFDSSETSQMTDALPASVVGLKVEKGGYGFGYSYLIPLARSAQSADRIERVGFELGFQRGWTPGLGDQVNHTIFARMRMLAQTEGQNFGTGPDLGAFYQLQNKKWGPSLGYSLGFVPAWNSGLSFLMRGGLEWPDWTFGFTIGLEIGWVF